MDQRPSNLDAMVNLYHTPQLSPHQCGSTVVQTINAPLSLVWSTVRRFDHPQAYKVFVRGCTIEAGDGGAARSVRKVEVVSGLPAETSTERLDLLDDESHVMVYSIIGGNHRLVNYESTVTLHEEDEKTVVVESYVVDVPPGNSGEDACCFANTIIRCNLKCLAEITEHEAHNNV